MLRAEYADGGKYMKMIFRYLKPFAPRISLGLTVKFIGSIMDLLLPWMLSKIIDDVVPQKNLRLIIAWGGGMVLASLLAWITNIIANRMAAWVSQHVTENIRHDLFEKISGLSCAQVDDFTISSLESRLTSDTYNIHNMVNAVQRIGIRSPILLIGGILITLTLDPVLSLVLVSTLPFLGILVFSVTKRGVPLYRDLQLKSDAMVLKVRENIAGIRVIKALSKTDYEKERFNTVNAEVVEKEKKAGITMGLTNPMVNLFLNIGLTMVVLVGAYRVNAGQTQPGAILAFLTYFTIITNAVMGITRIFVRCSKGAASGARISEVLEAPTDLPVTSADTANTPYHVEFDSVTFSYKKTEPSIENISFQLKAGETLGVIGATGSGKSTLAALLMRLYDPDSGVVSINGRPVFSLSEEELHTKFGVVFQNDMIFAESIYENIDFGRGLSLEEIKRAARCAQAEEFISKLPDGFDHMLTAKGTNLSGGQKQRVLLARALAGTPEILILDDSSSALDYKTDAALRKALREEYGGVTTVIIAQRVSSLSHADKILVLDEGKAVGYGTHSELMESCEIYSETARIQMQGEVG